MNEATNTDTGNDGVLSLDISHGEDEEKPDVVELPHQSSSSSISTIWNAFFPQMVRIDTLEKRIDEYVTRSRRRIQNVLDQTSSSYRKSHVRVFVTHSFDKYTGIWTLSIEGKQLIGNLDHRNANKVDTEGVISTRNEVNQGTCITTTDAASTADEANQKEGINAFTEGATTAASTTAAATATAATPDRNQYRIGSEEEEPILPIQFTHLFDRVEVTFRTIYQPRTAGSNTATSMRASSSSYSAGLSPPVKKSRSTKRKAFAIQQEPINDVDPKDLQASAPTILVWNKYKSALAASASSPTTNDAHAFWIKYNNHFSERPPPPNMKFHSIVAGIKLYPTRPQQQQQSQSQQSYGSKSTSTVCSSNVEYDSNQEPIYQIVNETLADKLFGGKYKYDNDTSNKPYDEKQEENPGEPEMKKSRADTEYMTTTSSNNLDKEYNIPLENDIHIPFFLSYNDIIMTIYQYIQDKKLYDPSDKSLIVCDQTLTDVFDVESFNFGQIKKLLFQKQIIKLVGVPTSSSSNEQQQQQYTPSYNQEPPQPVMPVVLTYVMNEKTTSPQIPTGLQEFVEQDIKNDETGTIRKSLIPVSSTTTTRPTTTLLYYYYYYYDKSC